MERIEKLVSSAIFFFISLLTILLLLEQYIEIPYWLQPLGRMHPLILHFPIAFVALLLVLNIFKGQLDEASYQKINTFLLLLAAFTTVLSAIMGFFLSREGYSSQLMLWHKWMGVAVSYLMYVLVITYKHKMVYQVVLYASFVAIIFAGHFGAGLTHGANFLMEPILKAQKLQIDEKTPVFTAYIKPILEAKCQSCHNSEKHKGDLDISSFGKLQAGGEHGPVWIPGHASSSEIIKRALLPLSDDAHMPPEGKSQLTKEELALIKAWIDNGASETIAMLQLSESDSLYKLVAERLANQHDDTSEGYAFDFVDEELVMSLNSPYRTVVQKATSSPAIDVNIYGRTTFQTTHLTELKPIKEQIVSLNLSYLPAEDDVLEFIGQLKNLEQLNLNFTNVTGSTFSFLKDCIKLSSLSLSGTKITLDNLGKLSDLVELKELFIWNTQFTDAQLTEIKSTLPNVKVELGYDKNTEGALKLTPPEVSNGKWIISPEDEIILTHKLNDVDTRYTIDGSDPDSASQLYTVPLRFDTNVTVKALSYKEGWLPSDVKSFVFYQKGYQPVSVEFLSAPEAKYKGAGAESLIDDVKGTNEDLPSYPWIGFSENPLSVIVDFGKGAPEISQLTLSYGEIIWRNVMAPASLEIWGGSDKQHMAIIKRVKPDQTKEGTSRGVRLFKLVIPKSQFRYYKVMAEPLNKPPKWHNKKGPAFLFVDQLFFY